jgi:uncharacterized protein (TIGR02246 family)
MDPRCNAVLVPFLLLALLGAVPRAGAQPAVSLDAGVAPHAGLDALYAGFAAAYDRLDAAAVAALYTEDAVYLAPGAEVLRGRREVEAYFERAFRPAREGGGRSAIRFEILERRAADGMVSDVGVYHLSRVGAGEAGADHRGKFATLALRGPDGTWRLHVDSYSGIDPPAAALPAADEARQDLLAAERAFAAAFARRDGEAFFAAVAPDAVFLSPDRTLEGRAAVEEVWGRLLEPEEPPFSWRPERGAVNADASLGLTTGPVFGPGGEWLGSFLSIWRRDPDGRWRVVFDGSPSCQPPEQP